MLTPEDLPKWGKFETTVFLVKNMFFAQKSYFRFFDLIFGILSDISQSDVCTKTETWKEFTYFDTDLADFENFTNF